MAPYLKWVFFYIPLAKESQFLFAFAWNAPEGNPQQFPWIVLPQGFRGNTLHFGQGPKRITLSTAHSKEGGKLLHYVDDTLICRLSQKESQQHTQLVLNSLAEVGYQFSKAKSQLVKQEVS